MWKSSLQTHCDKIPCIFVLAFLLKIYQPIDCHISTNMFELETSVHLVLVSSSLLYVCVLLFFLQYLIPPVLEISKLAQCPKEYEKTFLLLCGYHYLQTRALNGTNLCIFWVFIIEYVTENLYYLPAELQAYKIMWYKKQLNW